MAAFDIHDVCVELDLDLSLFDFAIELPGGISLDIGRINFPDPGDVSAKLLEKVNVALVPLTPLFDIVDTLLIIKEIFDAVKGLSPPAIGAAIPKLVKKLDKFKKLIPAISIPIMIRSLINVLLVLVIALRADIKLIIDAQSAIDLSAAKATALGLTSLTASLGCAQANLDAQLTITQNNAKPLNRLIGTLNLFMSLAGLDPLPSLTNLGVNANEALAPLDALIKALAAAKAALAV